MTAARVEDAPLPAGTPCGNYRIERVLGRGGMGAVYEAVHETIGQRAAVKVLLASVAAEAGAAERFFAEARLVSQIPHPSLIRIFDYGRLPSGALFLSMELLGGESLRARVSAGPRPLAETLDIGWQVADALAAIHAAGVVHRDLKPENLQIVPDPVAARGERVKVLDFGIAKQAHTGLGSAGLTTEGRILGTPLYMAPEQCEGSAITPAADVYALGVVLYELVAGGPPFAGPSGAAVLAQHLLVEPPPLIERAPQIPAALQGLIHSMLAKRPEERPAMAQVAVTLRRLQSEPAVAVGEGGAPGAVVPAGRSWPSAAAPVAVVAAGALSTQGGAGALLGERTAAVTRAGEGAASGKRPALLALLLALLLVLGLGTVWGLRWRGEGAAPAAAAVVSPQDTAVPPPAPVAAAAAPVNAASPPPARGAAPASAPKPRSGRPLMAGFARNGQEQRTQVMLSAGRCYRFVSSGSSSMRALYSYLWDPRGKRVATEKHDLQAVIHHCARMSGPHLFLVKPAGGDGNFRSVLHEE